MSDKSKIEEAAKKIVQEKERSLGNVSDIIAEGGPIAAPANMMPKEPTQMDIGFQNVPVTSLPSKGMFYPSGTKIMMRAATGKEIKHWSTLNEEDPVMLDGMLNYLLEHLFSITIPGKRASYKDLLDLDRLYLIFALNEYTFKDGENKIMAEIPLEDGSTEKVRVTKDVIDMFRIPEKLERFYDADSRGFKFTLDDEEFVLKLPTIGMSKFIYDLRQQYQRDNKAFDQDFAMYYLFSGEDWRTASEATFKAAAIQSAGWSLRRISLESKFVDLMTKAINPMMTVKTRAGEVTQPLNFQGGIKSLFVIPDILDELD